MQKQEDKCELPSAHMSLMGGRVSFEGKCESVRGKEECVLGLRASVSFSSLG